MAVLGLVAVGRGFARDDRHHAHFGVLFLDEVLTLATLYLAAEEQLEP
jgi:hypothetical protein